MQLKKKANYFFRIIVRIDLSNRSTYNIRDNFRLFLFRFMYHSFIAHPYIPFRSAECLLLHTAAQLEIF